MTKNTIIKSRISEKDKQAIFDYCKKNNINNVSNFIRTIILNTIKENEKNNGEC